MKTSTSLSNKPAGAFKTFPEFSKLTLADRGRYEALTRDFLPLSDLAFPTLMLWWNVLDSRAVSLLNGNVIISYWLPGMDKFSGLSIAGEHSIEESICAIFDHLQAKGERPRLVHVPEFVIAQIEHPDMFVCKPERAFDEYVYRVSSFCPINNLNKFRRSRVQSFEDGVGKQSIVVKSLDLHDDDNVRLLRHHVSAWRKTGYLNDSVKAEIDAIHIALDQHDMLGINNLCLYVDDELQGFCLYYYSRDKRYAVITNARMNTRIPRTLDYAIYAFAQKLSDEGVSFINMECDLGSKLMRTLKLSLGPCEFFRKYTIEPAK